MTDSQNPRKVQYNTKWNVFRDAIYWITLRQAQDEGLEIWQTRTNAIFSYDAVPADRVESGKYENRRDSASESFLIATSTT